MTNNLQTTPYLPRQRNFPNDDVNLLGSTLDKMYIEVAQRVNERTIGLYSTGFQIITGNTFFINKSSQQSLRKIYSFTSTASPIPHGLDFNGIERFVNCYGVGKDAFGQYFGLIFASGTAIPGQISFYLSTTNIVFVLGAVPPTLVTGTITLEWLPNI